METDENPDPGGSDNHKRPRCRSRSPPAGKDQQPQENPSTCVPNVPTFNFFNVLNNNLPVSSSKTTIPTRVTPLTNQNPSKPPQITVFNISINELSMRIKNIRPLSVIKVHYKLTQFGIKINVNNIDEFKLIREYFILEKIHFFSHPLREEKMKKFVMYGYHESTDDEILSLLNEQKITPTTVSKLQLRKKRYDDQCIYLLSFSYSEYMTLEKLRTIRALNSVIVRFEEYLLHRTGIIQCTNCLNFGHGQKHCYLTSRCIKCGAAHKSSACEHNLTPNDPKSKIPQSLVKCANCKGPHTANYSKCPKRAQYIQTKNISNTVSQKRKNVPDFPYTTTSAARTYSRPQPSADFHRSSKSTWAEVCRTPSTENVFSPLECYNIFKQFINEISKCKSKMEQLDIIARLTCEYLSNNDRP